MDFTKTGSSLKTLNIGINNDETKKDILKNIFKGFEIDFYYTESLSIKYLKASIEYPNPCYNSEDNITEPYITYYFSWLDTEWTTCGFVEDGIEHTGEYSDHLFEIISK